MPPPLPFPAVAPEHLRIVTASLPRASSPATLTSRSPRCPAASLHHQPPRPSRSSSRARAPRPSRRPRATARWSSTRKQPRTPWTLLYLGFPVLAPSCLIVAASPFTPPRPGSTVQVRGPLPMSPPLLTCSVS